jgi:hypothetical protein
MEKKKIEWRQGVRDRSHGRVLRTFLVDTGLLLFNCRSPIFLAKKVVDILLVITLEPPP